MARPRAKKRTTPQAAATDSVEPDATVGASSKLEEAAAEPATRERGKRVKAPPKPKPETEYFDEKGNFEDLWLSAFPVGTEWENIDKIKEFNWSFENVEEALEEGGELHGKTLYMFGSTEPLEDRLSRIDIFKTKIFTLGCTQRRSALKHLKIERVKKFDYCMPYYMPLQPLEDEENTTINFLYPLEPPIVDEFDWEMDDYEDFADQKVQEGSLPEGEKEKFKEFLKEKVRERKRELRQAKEARKKAIDDMDPAMKEAFENIKFYKFYPVKTPDTPDVNNVKARYINRYYRNAHYLK
ncbi:ATP/GTP binding protein-like [Zea mays]|uniref:ATP/GTP binding protein-like n=1 Tax=Zea mays TaxID=4577 RepID=A0A1D6J954_MAIZE|nr:ATP/GTP binding protein-like [Zea mays]